MSRTVERTFSEHIPARPDEVRDFYVDLHNIAELHPLIVGVRSVSRRSVAGGYQQTYRVKDLVPLGFVRLPIIYAVDVDVPRHGPVRTEARQFPGVRLASSVTFEPVAGGTLLTERVAISAPRPLLGVTVRQASAAHTEMLARIRRRFDRH